MTNITIYSNSKKGYKVNVDLEQGVYLSVDDTTGKERRRHALDYKVCKCNYFGTFYRVTPYTRLWVHEGVAYLVPMHGCIDPKKNPGKVRVYDPVYGRYTLRDITSYKKAHPATLAEVEHRDEINAWADMYTATVNVGR